jgi:hypothetical protein
MSKLPFAHLPHFLLYNIIFIYPRIFVLGVMFSTRCILGFRSSEVLSSTCWYLFIDLSGQPFCSISQMGQTGYPEEARLQFVCCLSVTGTVHCSSGERYKLSWCRPARNNIFVEFIRTCNSAKDLS